MIDLKAIIDLNSLKHIVIVYFSISTLTIFSVIWYTEENHDHDLRNHPGGNRGWMAGELRAWSKLNVSHL